MLLTKMSKNETKLLVIFNILIMLIFNYVNIFNYGRRMLTNYNVITIRNFLSSFT